mgnify:CR=1 FL=1
MEEDEQIEFEELHGRKLECSCDDDEDFCEVHNSFA